MSGLLNSSMNGSAPNIVDSTGRSYPPPFSVQSAVGSPGFHEFHHSGTLQGLHNIHGNFNVPSLAGTLPARNSTINIIPSGGMQQSTGSLLTGRFGSNNLPVVLSQISHGSSHGQSGVTNRGGMNVIGSPAYNSSTNTVGSSIPGVIPTSAAIGNRGAVPGVGVSPHLGNAGSPITNSVGNVAVSGSGYIGRSSSGAFPMPGHASRLNLSSNSSSGSLGLQGPNRLMTNGLQQQASPHLISMLGNSYAAGGVSLSQGHVQAVSNLSSMAMLNDVTSNDNSPFGVDDFPSLTSRPNSAGGAHGQIGSMRKQGIGGPTSQQNQEFSIQNDEDFPALPGLKVGNADYGMDFPQKDLLRDGSVPMIQNQNFSMGRSAGFTLGGAYPSPRTQQHQQHMPSVSGGSDSFVPVNSQGVPHLHGSVMFPSSNSMYHIQGNGPPDSGMRSINSVTGPLDNGMRSINSITGPLDNGMRLINSATGPSDNGMRSINSVTGPPDNGMRSMNSLTGMSGVPSYDQLMQQYQQQGVSQFHQRQIAPVDPSFRDHEVKPFQATQAAPDPYGLLHLLSIIRMSESDKMSRALGIDLTTLGLNLNASDHLHKTFSSPWSDKSAKEEPEFVVPECYYVYEGEPVPPLNHLYFMKFQTEALFYIFYSMPKDEAQLYAANELYRRGWFYHKEQQRWLSRFNNVEPLKTPTFERGSYLYFDPNTWETKRKDNAVIIYDLIEKRPTLHRH